MATEDIEIRVKVDANGAISTIDALGNKLEHIGNTFDEAARGGGVFEGFLQGIAQGVGQEAFRLLSNLPGTLINVGEAILEMADRGSAVDDLTAAFDNLNAKAGALGTDTLKKLQDATGETVNSFDLMKRANEAFLAGAKPDQYIELTKAARVLSETTGKDLAESIDAVTKAFITGQPRVLQNQLGVIDLKKAENDLAESLGVTREELTKEQQVQASRTAILEAARKKTEEFGEITNDAGDSLKRITAAIQDQKDKVALAVSQNDALNKSLAEFGDAIKKVDLKPLIDDLTRFITWAAKASSTTLPALVDGFHDVARGAQVLSEAFKNGFDFSKAIKGVAMSEIVYKEKQATDKFVESWKKLNDVMKAGAFAPTTNELKQLTEWVKNLEESTKLGNVAVWDYKGKIEEAQHALANWTKLVDDGTESQKGNKKATDDTAGAIGEIAKKADAAKISLAGMGSVGEVVAGQLGETGKKVLKTFQEVQDEAQKAGEEFGNIFVSGFQSILSGDLAGGIGSIFNGLGNKIGADVGKQLGAEFGEAFGAGFGGPVGSAIGSALFSKLGDQITNALSGDRGAMQDLFKEAFALPTGGLSMLIPDSIFDSVFGGDNAGTSFRKGVDKFFADAFDHNRLGVIIDGELRQIKDFDFGGTEFGDASKGFFDAFNGLDAAAQNAFSGLATAFNAALGQGEEFSSALAAVFANNLGGSLNNLQLMVQATGMSFDDMKNAAVEAFLDGKLSAQEAQRALAGIQQISEKGIPGALGAVTEAFHNLEEAGVKGGRVSTDAIRDIGAEAKELGIKTIPELMDYLVNVGGISADEVQKLMSTLAASGVDSIEEIVNATDESLIPILASLQDQNFPFKEAAEAASDFADSINDLPDEKRVKLIVDVETRGDKRALDAVTSGTTFSSSGPGLSGEYQ